jgi:hypothetical protein
MEQAPVWRQAVSPGDVEYLQLGKPHRPDAEVIGKRAKTLRFNEIAVGNFGKAKPAAMQGSVDQEHGSANAIEPDDFEMPDVVEVETVWGRCRWLVEAAAYVAIVAIIHLGPDRNESVEVEAAAAGDLDAIGDGDAVSGSDQPVQDVARKSPDVDIYPQRPVIVAVQLIALVYGSLTLWNGRPLYYTFSVDRLELVQASDLKADDIAAGRHENPALAPVWHSLPRWIWAPLPVNPEEAQKIVASTIVGGADVIQMPRLFRPWEQGLPELRKHLKKLDEMPYFSPAEKRTLKSRIAQLALPADQANAMVMWGGTRRVLAVFDLGTLELRALLRAD